MAAKLLDIATGGRQYVDRYELIGEIASGGMATVYLARLTGVGGFQRLFAIKRLHPHLQGEKEFVEMFLDEARLAAGIHHPNVVPILEVGASESGYYLVMEYIEGETLARLLARAASSKEKIPIPISVRSGLDFLAGLHAAHELRDENGAVAGVVHRDVSPQNVLVGADGVTRITDFGVARAATRLTATRVGQLKGKIAYMAPEQARGESEIDRRADVFAAGIVIWESLAHRRLFKAENEAATLARVISEPIPSLIRTAPNVPAAINQVVMKALERKLERRFQTCAEFADALERAAASNAVLGTSRDMQAYLRQVIGAEIQQQQAAVRAWAARSDADPRVRPHNTPSQSRQQTISGLGSETLPEPTYTSMVTTGRGGVISAVLAIVLLGVGGFFGYRIFKGAADPPTDVPAQVDLQKSKTPSEPTPPEDGAQRSHADSNLPEGRSLEDLPAEEPGAQEPAPTEATPTPRRAPVPPPAPRAPSPRGSDGANRQAEDKPKKDPLDILGTNPYR